jgi:ABC-type transport system involved in cytochrome bd biosynthesis fused ATPase/permease subunit
VGVARALLSPARVLLLDEPTAHLDAASAARLLDLLAGEDRTVLLVTHQTAALDGRWRVVDLSEPARVTAADPAHPRPPGAVPAPRAVETPTR